MEGSTYKQKYTYKSKAKVLAEAEPFKITKVQLAQECYVDKETLRAFQTAIFTGSFKTAEGSPWTVSLMPDNFQPIGTHKESMKVYSKVGLQVYFSLPPWGMDVKRCYQLLSTLDEEGNAKIDGPDGSQVQVKITDDMVSEALKLPKGSQSLLTRNTTKETNATFLLGNSQEYTFRDLVRKEVEQPLRFFTQHFTHGKATRYTKPHRRVANFFSKTFTSNRNWTLNFAELILSELKSFSKRKKVAKMQHMNCGMMLTRLGYYVVGMIDDIPPAHEVDEWIAKSSTPAPKTVKDPKDITSPSKSTRRSQVQAQAQGKKNEEEDESSELPSSSEDEEKTDTESE